MRQKQFFKSHYMSKNACYFASEKSWLLLSVLSVNSQSEQVAITLPSSLIDHHALDEDIIYTIIQALRRQIGVMMCVIVFMLPHMTPPLPYNNVI